MSFGDKPSLKRVVHSLGQPVAFFENKNELQLAWATDHPDIPHFVGLFKDGHMFGFSTDINDKDFMELKARITDGMLNECWPNGLNSIRYKKQIGGGDL